MPEQPDLEFVETGVLLEELFKRHDHAVFCGLKVMTEEHGGITNYRRSYKGNAATCAGLGLMVGNKALEDLHK